MEVSSQIKKLRTEYGLSQEELAEKVYVSRQTVSNWETGKNYPDLKSLLLLGELFEVSLDELIKGDLTIMKKEILDEDVKAMDHYGKLMLLMFVLMLIFTVPLFLWLKFWAYIPFIICFALPLFYFAGKVEKIKKKNNVQTYKEIVAFQEKRQLSEAEVQQEIGKRPYQKILMPIAAAAVTLVVLLGMIFIILMIKAYV